MFVTLFDQLQVGCNFDKMVHNFFSLVQSKSGIRGHYTIMNKWYKNG